MRRQRFVFFAPSFWHPPAFVHAAQAQHAVLVSNVGQTATDTLGAGSNFVLAQGFTTGASALGYTLSSIEVRLENGSTTDAVTDIPTVKVVQGQATGTEIATLDGGSASISANATVNRTYTAPLNTILAASTTYYVVIEGGSADLEVSGTTSDSEDGGGATGWSIADNGFFRFAVSIGIFTNTSQYSFMIRVNGSARNAPVFDDETLSRSIAENTAADSNVGDPIPAAMDADGQTPTYTMEGADATSFDFDASTRQIETRPTSHTTTRPSPPTR